MFIFIFHIGIWITMAKIFMNLARNDFRFVFIRSNFHFKNTIFLVCDFFSSFATKQNWKRKFCYWKDSSWENSFAPGLLKARITSSRPPSLDINTRTHALSLPLLHTHTLSLILSLTHTHSHARTHTHTHTHTSLSWKLILSPH